MHRSAGIALVLLGLAAAAGVAACGGSGESTVVTDTERESTPGTAAGGDSIVINTDVVIDIPEGDPKPQESIGEGEVRGGSLLGDSPFCVGGTFNDVHSDDPEIGLVDRTFDCADGSLRIGFTPGSPEGRTQAGPWSLVSGTGAFEGLNAEGEMEIEYKPGTRSTKGRETFTGTVAG